MQDWIIGFAGMGLLFTGLRMVGAEVQQLSGGRVRAWIAATLGRPAAPQIVGVLSGACTQSAGAVTFAAGGLVSAGAATLGQALPLLAWSSVGTSFLVLAAAVDLRLMAFLLFGCVGCALLMRMDRHAGLRPALYALLGLALLLFGVGLLKTAVSGLKDDPQVGATLLVAGGSFGLAFLLGVVSGSLLQSAQVATVLLLPLVQAGLLGLAPVAAVIYGASLGTGLGRFLVAGAIDLPGRRLTLAGLVVRAAGVVLLVLLHWIEVKAGVPLLLSLVSAGAANPGLQVGLLYLASQVVIALSGEVAGAGIARRVELWLPDPAAAEPAELRPAHLPGGEVRDPAGALLLCHLEYSRLAAFLPHYLDDLLAPEERPAGAFSLARRHGGSTAILGALEGCLTAVLRAEPSARDLEALVRLRTRLALLRALQASLHGFAQDVAALPAAERPARVERLVQGLHAVLGVAAEALGPRSTEDDRRTLRKITGERGALMEQVRQSLLERSGAVGNTERLVDATLHFEKCLWLLRRLADDGTAGAE
jgi:phosphate:Na+ symporter